MNGKMKNSAENAIVIKRRRGFFRGTHLVTDLHHWIRPTERQ